MYFSPWLGAFNTFYWQCTPLSITCSIFHWQHHTICGLQRSHVVTHEVELWRLLEEMHTCHCTFITNLRWSCPNFCSHHILSLFLHISLWQCSLALYVHAPLVHHTNRSVYSSHHGWAFDTLQYHIHASPMRWQTTGQVTIWSPQSVQCLMKSVKLKLATCPGSWCVLTYCKY